MIEIIEKERYYDDSLFTGQCFMYPTYMVKDGKEYFMFNRREPDDKWKLEENEDKKKQLISNDGAYMTFYGYENPFEMIREIAKRKHHFTEPKDLYRCGIDKNGFLDFHGNRHEVSAAFFYRIYDETLARKVQKAVDYLNKEEWENAIKAVEEAQTNDG